MNTIKLSIKLFFIFLLIRTSNNVNADIFLKLNNVPQHGSNLTQLCVSTLKIEAPDANVTIICGDDSKFELITSDYALRGIFFRNVDGNGTRSVPYELNQELNRTGFFIEKDGSVIAVINDWRMNDVIWYILLFYVIFTLLTVGVFIFVS